MAATAMRDLTENLLMNRLQVLIAWLGILVSIGAAALAASYSRRSRWAGLVAAGFALMAVNQTAAQVLIPLIVKRQESDVAMQVSRTVFGISVLGLTAQATLVLGVAGAL